MAASGFEGFEKRLELRFFGQKSTLQMGLGLGLRLLEFSSLVRILDTVQCEIVSAIGNRFFDSYVLSESSMFVFPDKIIIKTCGTTQLLKALRPLILQADKQLSLSCSSCRYSRGSFIFPQAQPFPHTSFTDEVRYIEDCLPKTLSVRKASVMGTESSPHTWHVFTAAVEGSDLASGHEHWFTLEVCMTGLDPVHAAKFFLPRGAVYDGNSSGREMTMIARVGEINPMAIICDFGFDPCGYSMNGIDGCKYSTIHVTPEDGYSYASFECSGFLLDEDDDDDVAMTLTKAIQVFCPACVSIAATSPSCMAHELTKRVARAAKMLGLSRRSCCVDEFAENYGVVVQTFSG